jgi:formyl-CoA transferase
MAICAALNAPERGGFIDVSMLEATLATMGWAVSNWLVGGVEPRANGNENTTSAPSGAFQAADGLLNIAANKDEQWDALARHLGREDLLSDPRYVDREARKANRLSLKAELETVLTTRPATEWEQELNRIGVPAGAVLSVPEVLAHPQVADRGMIARYDDVPGVDRPVAVLRTGVKIDGIAPAVASGPPALGADNAAVWADLGIGAAELARLDEEGVI